MVTEHFHLMMSIYMLTEQLIGCQKVFAFGFGLLCPVIIFWLKNLALLSQPEIN